MLIVRIKPNPHRRYAVAALVLLAILASGLPAASRSVARYYYHDDPASSSVVVTDTAGAVVGRYKLDPFGNVTHTEGTKTDEEFLFQGKERDSDSGLYYFGQRYYDPTIGRFIGPDPQANPNDPRDLNLYNLGFANPTRYGDPTGAVEDPFLPPPPAPGIPNPSQPSPAVSPKGPGDSTVSHPGPRVPVYDPLAWNPIRIPRPWNPDAILPGDWEETETDPSGAEETVHGEDDVVYNPETGEWEGIDGYQDTFGDRYKDRPKTQGADPSQSSSAGKYWWVPVVVAGGAMLWKAKVLLAPACGPAAPACAAGALAF